MTGEINTNSDPDPYDDELELGRATAVPVKIIGKPNVTLAPEFGGATLGLFPILMAVRLLSDFYTNRPTQANIAIVSTSIWILSSISGSGQT